MHNVKRLTVCDVRYHLTVNAVLIPSGCARDAEETITSYINYLKL